MASINLIKVTETLSEGRFDAEYFHSKYHLLDSTLHSLENKIKLGTLSNFIKKGIFDISPKKYRTTGIPLIRTTQIKSLISNEDNLIFIDREEHIKNHIKTELLSGDIVFTKIGAGIGDVAILNKHYANYNFSQNVAGASIKRDKINPYYLICFLNSYYGREQIMRFMMPSGQGKLELKDIKKIQIFRTEFEDKIADIIVKAEYTANQSQILYKQATDLLEQELGLDKISFDKPKSYAASFSEVVNGSRVDADYFQPMYNQLLNKLSKFDLRTISYLSDKLETGVYSSSYSNEGINYIRGTNISANGTIKSDDLLKTNVVNPNIHNTAIVDDLLVTRVGSIGVCGIVLSKNINIYSDNLIRIRIRETNKSLISAKYILLFLQSRYGQMLMTKYSGGSVQQRLNQSMLNKIPIPIISYSKQLEIEELYINSINASAKSKQLLDDAKARVEQLIEESAN